LHLENFKVCVSTLTFGFNSLPPTYEYWMQIGWTANPIQDTLNAIFDVVYIQIFPTLHSPIRKMKDDLEHVNGSEIAWNKLPNLCVCFPSVSIYIETCVVWL